VINKLVKCVKMAMANNEYLTMANTTSLLKTEPRRITKSINCQNRYIEKKVYNWKVMVLLPWLFTPRLNILLNAKLADGNRKKYGELR